MSTIDLTKAKRGDTFRTRDGNIVVYCQKTKDPLYSKHYPHSVAPEGAGIVSQAEYCYTDSQLIAAEDYKGAIAQALLDAKLLGDPKDWHVTHVGTTEWRAGVVRTFWKTDP